MHMRDSSAHSTPDPLLATLLIVFYGITIRALCMLEVLYKMNLATPFCKYVLYICVCMCANAQRCMYIVQMFVEARS